MPSPVVNVRGAGRVGGWVRVILVERTSFLDEAFPADSIYRAWSNGRDLRSISRKLRVPRALLEDVVRWYARKENRKARREALRG